MRAFNPSRYERAFDVRLVLSGTVAPQFAIFLSDYKYNIYLKIQMLTSILAHVVQTCKP